MIDPTAKMRYQQFPDEETCHALSEMKAYYAAIGTTPIQVFKNIDVNNKGALTYWDFYKGFKNKGFKFEQKVAEKLMALLDREGAGTVSAREFEKVFSHLEYKTKKKVQLEAKASPPANVWEMLVDKFGTQKDRIEDRIKAMDTDKSGSLTYWEFSQGLKKIGLRLEKSQVETLLAALDRDGDGEVSVAEFVSGVIRQVDVRFGREADANARKARAEQRERERELERLAYEEQQRDAMAASELTAYQVRSAWNKVNRAIAKKGAKSMVKLFDEFDEDGNGVVDRDEFKEGMTRLGVKLSRAEFEACWQYADPRGEGHISKESFVHGLGEIDPAVDEATRDASQKKGHARRKSLSTVSSIDSALKVGEGQGEDGPGETVELHDAWLELCKYFGKGKARALATFKAIDTDGGGTLDKAEFRVFVAMLNLKLSDDELEALWRELDADQSGELSFLELQAAVTNREREAGAEKRARDAAKAQAEKSLKASATASAEVLKTAEYWEQIGEFMERQGEEASRAFFMSYDSTGHGTLSKEEFFNAILAGPKVELEDPAIFDMIWEDVDLTGHNEVEFEEIWTNVTENKLKAEQVISGTWLPTAKDKQKAIIKADTARRKAKEAAAAATEETKRIKKELLEVKRGKLAKASGNEQIKLKAMQMRTRRKALAEERNRKHLNLGYVPFDKLRLYSYATLFAAAVSYGVQTQVFYILEGTDDFMLLSSVLLAAAAISGMATSLLQHWTSLLVFFALTVWALIAVALQLASNLNTWHFLTYVAGSCYSPRDSPNSENFCFDEDGRSDVACVCTDVSTGQCYEFTPGVASSGCNPKVDAVNYLLMAMVVGGVAFATGLAMWATIGCTAPIRGQPYGWYYLVFARRKLAAALRHRRKAQQDTFGSTLKDYQRKKSQKKAQKGFEVLVENLNAATKEGGGDFGVFQRMDVNGSGKLDQLAFRGGLQVLGVKANPADLAKLWDFMDSDHSGAIAFPDFATGLKVATKSLGGDGGDGADLEAGGEGNMNDMLEAKAKRKEITQEAWNKVHAVLDRFQLPPVDFFAKKLDMDEAGDLDKADFEEALVVLGLTLSDDHVSQLWQSIVAPPSDLINADDFAAAVEKNPPS